MGRMGNKMGRVIEARAPLFFAILAALAVIFYGHDLISLMSSGRIKPQNLYTSLFNLFAILSAFVFGFYTFVRTGETRFLNQFRRTASFRIFMRYVLHSVLLSSIAILATLPLLLFEPKPGALFSAWFVYIVLWVFVSCYAIFACARSAVIFAVLTRVDAQPDD